MAKIYQRLKAARMNTAAVIIDIAQCMHILCCVQYRHGFVGILVLAAWPNAAFDLCGICCGHFLMPFWDFFGATFIGKAILKVCQPACFFTKCL